MGFELEAADLYKYKMAVEEPMMVVVMSCTVKWSLETGWLAIIVGVVSKNYKFAAAVVLLEVCVCDQPIGGAGPQPEIEGCRHVHEDAHPRGQVHDVVYDF